MNIDQLSVQDLIYLMIVVSDNTATNTLIDHFGLQHINLFIQETLQCEQTQLNRYMMDAEAISENHILRRCCILFPFTYSFCIHHITI